ncbi:MAG: hypothetical protein AAGA33_06915 [Pseudomonadota bacterium]
MNDTTHTNDNERFLEPYIASARQSADDEAVAEAAARLRQGLPAKPESRAFGWNPRFATAAVLITGLALTLNLLVPGGSGTAFAEVQAWFSSFQTVDVQTTIVTGGDELVSVRVRANADGDTRIEQAGIVHVLNVDAGTFSTLLPGKRYFDQPIERYRESDANAEWVEKLRTFQGEAVALTETRLIDGRSVSGHSLVIDEIKLILWSDVGNKQPVLLEGRLPGGLLLETRFVFDTALSPQLFTVPADFQPVAPD